MTRGRSIQDGCHEMLRKTYYTDKNSLFSHQKVWSSLKNSVLPVFYFV